ncbi:MAG: HAMP domain-containing histidine kinase [Gammaproteobacteria bacterium]|nr:HAMP domain-containing histidine kinase [Gammaproteobacteria bacterium]
MTHPSDIDKYDNSADGKYEWALSALDVLASMRTFQDIVNKQSAKDELYLAARIFVNQLISMDCVAFMEINSDDMSFVLADCFPEEQDVYIQEIIDDQIEKGNFAWAIQQNKIVSIALQKDKSLLLHALVTPLGVKGMFVGILDSTIENMQGIALDTVSVVIQNLSSSLDTYFSKQLVNNYNQQLEVTIKYRTRELEEAKKLAEAANVAKSEFLASMSHELNTPFNIIFGYLDLMMEDLELVSKDDARFSMIEDLKKITTATKSLNKMVSNIVYLAKLESGRIKPNSTAFLVKEMLQKLAQSHKDNVKINKNVLNVNFRSEQLLIENDQQLIEKAIDNLLDNACKFTKNGTIEILVSNREVNEKIAFVISVIDTGIGIEDDNLKMLCSSFTQADGSEQRRFEGLGLGLAITNRLCHLIGATLELKSKPGEGANFSIILPL